ncbi:MAG: sulfotransferase family protein [Candidatus Sumerlaeaceae bacterium]
MNKAKLRRRHALLRGWFRVLPDFAIIGVQKGGTGTLYNTLVQHPAIAAALTKEVTFFDRHFRKGKLWYRAHFPTIFQRWRALRQGRPFLVGEASPGYIFIPFAAENARRTIPNGRFVALLRNPIDRAYSHYQHELRKGCEKLTFEEALDGEEERLKGTMERAMATRKKIGALRHFSYKQRGHYAEQLERWYAQFPREQILVLRTEDFAEKSEEIVQQVCAFLGVPPMDLKEYKRFNVGSYKDEMKPETRTRLVEYFRPYNAQLKELTGRDFGWDR